MKVNGIGVANGYGIGRAFVYEKVKLQIESYEVTDIEREVSRLSAAILQSKHELEALKKNVQKNLDDDHGAIFEAHIHILLDPVIKEEMVTRIREEHQNASFVLQVIVNDYIKLFESLDDAYMQQRAVDLEDVFFRVQCHLHGVKPTSLAEIIEPVVVVCDDLTPSDTASLDPNMILGIVTNVGARTSHSGIMARSLEIPAVLGTQDITAKVDQGDWLILDGGTGEVFIQPSDAMINKYLNQKEAYERYHETLMVYKDKVTTTKCGKHIALAANIGSENDLEQVIKYGAEGIGLFRTEFLYMNSQTLPSESEQYDVYKRVLTEMNNQPVVIRTLDIGGDKYLPYMTLPKEMNPFLGHRAIRLCFEREDIFKTQLRALLRASIYGTLKIMFPMIATIDEFLKAKRILLSVKEELLKEQIPVSEDIEIGIMVEIPATAVLAEQFACHVDFFSIGTNDLIQYTFAADRMNEQVAYLYQPFNPSLLHLISMVAKAGEKHGKWVGMCGEMAGDLNAAPLLVGLGLTELSMSATSILSIRKSLSTSTYHDLKIVSEKALLCQSEKEVKGILNIINHDEDISGAFLDI